MSFVIYVLATLISVYFGGFLITAAWAFIEKDHYLNKRDLFKLMTSVMLGSIWPWILYDTIKRKFF